MKHTVKVGGLGALLIIGVWITLLATSLYGLYLAFSASIILGIVILVIEPLPLIFGALMLLFDLNLATKIMELFQ